MSNLELGGVILVCSALIVGISATAFVYFSRFMKNEKAQTERFREIHGDGKGNGDRGTGNGRA